MHIEDTVCSDSLPVNSKAMLARLVELLDENQTNCLANCQDDPRIRKVMWLIMGQVFGQLAEIDMMDLWQEFNHN